MITRRHESIQLNHRTIVISDIHGTLTLFQKLLEKVNYTSDDNLIILGDIIEKGPAILDTLHEIQTLNQRENVYVLTGNCEWAIYDLVYKEEYAPYFTQYLAKQPNTIFKEVAARNNKDITGLDGNQLQLYFQEHMKEELDYMNSLITTLETENYLFVHAGIEERIDYQNSSLSSLLEQQRFLERNHPLDKFVVVGHLPTANYHTNHINNDIIIDKQKKVICIDGGNQVKKIGQLNALIIEGDQITTESVHQDYPIATVLKEIKVDHYHHHKIYWPEYELEILEEGEDFSICRKIPSNEILSVKNEYILSSDSKYYGIDDYVDYQMSIPKGEKVEIIEIVGRYAYILYQNELSWIKITNIEYER